jgi:hypothetical protein
MKRLPLTSKHRELLAMPTIVSQLPVVFENGMRWSAIACRCYLCDHELPDTKVRGTISRAFPRVAVLDGACMTIDALPA